MLVGDLCLGSVSGDLQTKGLSNSCYSAGLQPGHMLYGPNLTGRCGAIKSATID